MDIIRARGELIGGKTIYDMKLKVASYGRVSTDKDDQLNSLDNQINYFKDMIGGVKNWTHVCSYSDEGISGTQVFKREEFLRMIEDAKLGKIDLILTKEVSRFARNTIDSIKYTQLLLSYGVIVFFISDNINTIYPDSEFRLTLMASMAQDEVRKLSERVKFGIKRSIKDGRVGGGGIYGYDKLNCKLTINEEEAEVVRKIFNLYATGEYGFKKIGEMLASEGHFTRKGKVFSDITLRKMILNPRYKGYYTANLSEVQDYKTHKKIKKPKSDWIVYKDTSGAVPGIVTEELWNKANNIHDERYNRWNKNVLNKEFYLTNRNYTSKIYCKEHNTTFIRCANGKRKENPVWQCNEYLRHGIKGCATPILYEKHLNEIFATILEKFIDNKDEIINNIVNDYKKLIKESNGMMNIETLKDKLSVQETYKERLFDMFLKKLINDDEFKEKNDKINNEILNLKKEITKLEYTLESDVYYESIINKIRNIINPQMDIRNNIGEYFNLFIDKVFVSKIDNDRKHLKLEIIFNFNIENAEIEIDGRQNKENDNSTKDYQKSNNYNKKSPIDDNYLKQKYLSINPQVTRVFNNL